MASNIHPNQHNTEENTSKLKNNRKKNEKCEECRLHTWVLQAKNAYQNRESPLLARICFPLSTRRNPLLSPTALEAPSKNLSFCSSAAPCSFHLKLFFLLKNSSPTSSSLAASLLFLPEKRLLLLSRFPSLPIPHLAARESPLPGG